MKPEVQWLVNYFNRNPFIQDLQDTVETLDQWANMTHGYKSKQKRIKEWSPKDEELWEVAYHIFAMTLLHPSGITYQALIGAIANHVKCADTVDRIKIAAELIALAYQCELIVITKVSDKTFMVTTDHVLNIEMPKFIQHMPLFDKPKPIEYIALLGGRLKKHDGDICVDHIDRMNAIPLCLETRVINTLAETTKNDLDTAEKIIAWNQFVEHSHDIYDLIRDHGNLFYLEHSNDTRGRVYASGYCVGYQGSSYKKAIVQLANKEIVKL